MRATILAVLATLMVVRAAGATPATEIQYVMGTYLRLTVEAGDDPAARAVMHSCFVEARRLDAVFSRFDSRSELARLNALPAEGTAEDVSPDMAALLDRALALRAATAGAFDVGVGALTTLWRTTDRWPAQSEIERAQHGLGPGALALAGTTLVRRSGVVIDVDGIAKGWAVDHCVATLRSARVRHAFINFGESSLYGLGAPRGRADWPVLVRGLDRDSTLGVLRLRDQAASVSGVFGRARQVAGRRVGHIVDPRTGLPLVRPAEAVVVAPSATDAEAWSKAVLLRGGAVLARAGAALDRGEQIGAVLVDSRGLHRFGAVALDAHARPVRIAAADEVLE